ncbi:hypothetical protein BH09MYX1_BH09MYX1_42790 [soil metagenome]
MPSRFRHPSSWVFALLYVLLAVVFGVLSRALDARAAVYGWLAAVSLVLAFAYATGNPRIHGKRADGSFPWFRRILFLPHLVVIYAVWHGRRILSREPAWDEIAPGLYLGRWPRRVDCPKEVTMIVDLTAELPRDVVGDLEYVLVPTLDGCPPSIEDLEALARRIASHEGTVYVHCAAGHGRSAAVMAAALVLRGKHGSLDEVVRHMRQRRPGVYMSGVQRRLLRAWDARRTEAA